MALEIGSMNIPNLKKESLLQFSCVGFPTQREEAWKYTDVKFLESYTPDSESIEESLPDDFVRKLPSLPIKVIQFIFVNGELKKINNLEEDPIAKDMIISPFSQAILSYPEQIKPFLMKNYLDTTDTFIHLNTAFLQKGFFLYVPKNSVVRTPIHLLFITKNAQSKKIYHPRNIFIIDESSKVVIFEEHISADDTSYCKNVVTHIELKTESNLDYYKLQNENKNTTHIATTKIDQYSDSQLCSNTISIGGKLSRDNLTISLNEVGASCQLNGLSFGVDQQHMDHHTRIDHFAPQTNSDQYYKNVLDDTAVGVFNGKIIVHPNAINTKSNQRNKNLLLSKTAEMNTKPELEIYADDVQCSHGATVGQMDLNALFYLRSRGVPEKLAVTLLTQAFTYEIFERMKHKEILFSHFEREIQSKDDIKSHISSIRAEFPILHQKMHGVPLIYLDNANTTQKPNSVIQTINDYYIYHNANVHRSVYALSEQATALYEAVRDKVQTFIHAKHRHEIIFTKGTTEAINLIADSFGRLKVGLGDEVLISAMEHHSNLVPWQFLCERTGANLKIIPITPEGELDLEAFSDLLSPRTRLVAVTHVSNVLGTINPVKKIIEIAHARHVPVLLDGAQAVPHLSVDMQALDCDFYTFSSHKMYGPTGVGVLYGKSEWLEAMPPYHGGGNMIREVTWSKTTYADLPYKFEGGTADIAGVIGLGTAIDFLVKWGMNTITHYEDELLKYAISGLQSIPGLRLIGMPKQRTAVISFILKDLHPHDLGTALDQYGIAVRVGHHCAMPLMNYYQVPATVRASFGIYNTFEEIDILVDAIEKVRRFFNNV